MTPQEWAESLVSVSNGPSPDSLHTLYIGGWRQTFRHGENAYEMAEMLREDIAAVIEKAIAAAPHPDIGAPLNPETLANWIRGWEEFGEHWRRSSGELRAQVGRQASSYASNALPLFIKHILYLEGLIRDLGQDGVLAQYQRGYADGFEKGKAVGREEGYNDAWDTQDPGNYE